jgi:hypothetical protein
VNNLLISYDLYKPDRDYTDLFARIKSLGAEWAHLKLTLWFVKSNMDAATARDRVWDIMQPQDKLIVINASANAAAWYGLDATASEYLRTHWVN